jgi:outer membrane protein assembly factor BamB
MSDLELLELIHSKSPEELSVAEIDALRQGIAASRELRREVAERVEMEQYLYQALARVNVSVDAILSRATSEVGRSPGALLRLRLAAVAVAVVSGTIAIWAVVSPKSPEDRSVSASSATDHVNVSSPRPEVPKPGKAIVETDPGPSDPSLPVAIETPGNEPAQVTAAEPWQQDPEDSDSASQRTLGLYRTFDPNKPPLIDNELRHWFAPVEGQRGTLGSRDVGGGKWGLIEGLLRLKASLKPGHAIRLTVWDWNQLRIHVWAGDEGASLRHFGHRQSKPWVGYTTARKDGVPVPTRLRLAATDDDRFWRTNPQSPVTLQLRHADGLLTLSHGAVRLLDIPLSVPPTEIYFEGSALLRELAVTPAAELPRTSNAPPLVKVLTPASQSWAKPAAGTGMLLQNADGSVELRAEKYQEPAIARLSVVRSGIAEFVCEISDPQAGTGVCLLDAQGDPIYLAAFARNQAVNLLQIGNMNPQAPSLEISGDVNEGAVPLVGDRTWIKLTLASGWVKLELSVDGRHFARAGDPTSVEQAVSGIGLYAVAHPSARSIHLKELELHALDAVNQLAPAELREKAGDIAALQVFDEFQAAADKVRPQEADRDAWQRACAIRRLAAGVPPALGAALIEYLLESSRIEMPLDQRLHLLEQLASLVPSWRDEAASKRYLRHYEKLGQELVNLECPNPYSEIAISQMLSPLWMPSPIDFFPAGLARHEALRLALAQQWDQLNALLTRLEFFHFPKPAQAENYYRWLASLSDRQQSKSVGSRIASSAEWRHPFTTELSKEGFNVLADLQVALESNAYRDACQVIGSANASGMQGLLPDSQDPELSVSLAATIALAMREHPQFRETMAEQFGPLGRLRVRQAIALGDADAVEAATIQFYGTEAAAEAHLWLADRAASSGAFAAAQGHYRAARPTAPKELVTRLIASEQLTAALIGHDAGLNPQGTIELGNARVRATDILELSNQLRATRAAENVIGGAAVANSNEIRLLPPGDIAPVPRARFEGETGQRPRDVPGTYRQPEPDWPERSIDWVAEQIDVQTLKDRMLISNRFQLASYDPTTGSLQWRVGLGGDMASAHDWPLAPMRPLATSELAFVRRLPALGPTLAAINLASGQLKWETRLDGEHWIVSDPALVGSTLYACTVRHNDLGFTLHLGAFDPLTGVVLRERKLVDLRDTWGPIRDCQMLSLDESFVITCGGAVLRCDLMGDLRWARQRLWIPPAVDAGWVWQSHRPPTLVDGRLIVVQPCVPDVVALNPDNGRLLWRSYLTTARRVVGASKSQVLVATCDGVCALETHSGKQQWHYRADLLDGNLFSKSDGLLIALREPVEKENLSCAALTWLDTATGKPKHTCVLSDLKHQQPCLGPMFAHQSRIWTLYGKGLEDPTRDLLELTPKMGLSKCESHANWDKCSR